MHGCYEAAVAGAEEDAMEDRELSANGFLKKARVEDVNGVECN